MGSEGFGPSSDCRRAPENNLQLPSQHRLRQLHTVSSAFDQLFAVCCVPRGFGLKQWPSAPAQ
eukprot:9016531-Alexandrium_andersonii.AAC.1